MSKKGFTLVELLAMLVVLGVLMAVTVPNITGILSQSKNNILKDDVTKMVDTAKMKMATDESVKKPKKGYCIVFTLNNLNINDDFKSGPNGEPYDKYNSFVVVRRIDNNYKYYVTLLEKADDGYYGVEAVEYSDFEKDGDSKIKTISSATNKSNLNENSELSDAVNNANVMSSCYLSSNVKNFYN